jgi:hypothetical protein
VGCGFQFRRKKPPLRVVSACVSGDFWPKIRRFPSINEKAARKVVDSPASDPYLLRQSLRRLLTFTGLLKSIN